MSVIKMAVNITKTMVTTTAIVAAFGINVPMAAGELASPISAMFAPQVAARQRMTLWSDARLCDTLPSEPPDRIPGLYVVENHDPVQRNSRNGGLLRLGTATFGHGLYCHAPSRVEVRLPGPAAEFCATIGVDSNNNTSGGRGSVVFRVESSDGEILYESPRMTEADAAREIRVPLGGEVELTLVVTDAGDGISCDQADWADARIIPIVFDNPSAEIRLGDFPLLNATPVRPLDTAPPFSFVYNGKTFAELLADPASVIERTVEQRLTDKAHTAVTRSFRDPETGLEVRCEAVVYADFPVVEWTLYFRNNGSEDTPIIENIRSLDTAFPRLTDGVFRLHHHNGSPCRPDDFAPYTTLLGPGQSKRITTSGGRPTNSAFPYFNIEAGGSTTDDGVRMNTDIGDIPDTSGFAGGPRSVGGVIAVVSWAGQWDAEFRCDADSPNEIRILAGQERTKFRLHPGEEVRSPMSVIMFHDGDWITGQNLWRRWMLAHNVPRDADGQLPMNHFAACSSHQYGEMIHSDTASQQMFIQGYLDRRFPLDFWWMDAGWYPNRTGWPDVGTWEVDRTRFPGGLRDVSDFAHQRGVRTIVWFEPERTMLGRWIADTHPEWILSLGDDPTCLLDLGNDAARKWLINHVNGLIDSEAIDLYRQDFNMDPLEYWRHNDAPDRQGITEIQHVTGYYAYWDALQAQHPGMLIDTCASGGRRLDLETLRRSVPLLRSDYIIEPVGNQGHTWGLSLWLPYHGTGSGRTTPYELWSVVHSFFTACFDMRPGSEFAESPEESARTEKIIDAWKWKVAPNLIGDYYPLTPYSLAADPWIAWEFYRPEMGTGTVMAFRRDASPYESIRVRLRGLAPDARYLASPLSDEVSEETSVYWGRELMESGLRIEISERPGVAVIAISQLITGQ